MADMYKSYRDQQGECITEGNLTTLPSAGYDIDYPNSIVWCKKFNTRCFDETCLDRRIRGVNPRTGRKEYDERKRREEKI